MMAESHTEAPFALKRIGYTRALERELKKLFMGGATVIDPATRIERAREKIEEARTYLEKLRIRYPAGRYPRDRFGGRWELFSRLEASYHDAEDALQNFQDLQLRRIK